MPIRSQQCLDLQGYYGGSLIWVEIFAQGMPDPWMLRASRKRDSKGISVS
jgi:hypothetical protein